MDSSNRIADALIPKFLDELKKVARAQLDRVQAETLQPTAVIHEVYLRLVRADVSVPRDEREFLAVARTAVRNAILDYVRRKNRVKRPAPGSRRDLEPLVVSIQERGFNLVEIDDLLESLRRDDPDLADVVDFRVFLGFNVDETAQALGLAPRTVGRRWKAARALLADQLKH